MSSSGGGWFLTFFPAWSLHLEPFPHLRNVLRNGPEPSRARRCLVRRSEPLTARTVLRESGKRERLSTPGIQRLLMQESILSHRRSRKEFEKPAGEQSGTSKGDYRGPLHKRLNGSIIDDSSLLLDDGLGYPVHRLMRCPFRPISIRPRLEISFEDRLQDKLHRPLTTRSRIEGIERTRTFLPPSFGISFFRAAWADTCV